jgi:Domain of unknown function (DUF4350)
MAVAQPTNTRSLLLPVLGVALALVLILVGALLAGRRDEQLPTAYGRRRGADSVRSVNGTSVLAEYFKRAGHRVTSFGRFSPRLNEYDIIVWVPNDFEPPTKEQREFLEDWLADGSNRTVIYVGRDYDAAVAYWDRIAPQLPTPQTDEALRRKAEARASFESKRSQMPTQKYARWFTVRRDQKPQQVTQLNGPWAEGIDAAKADIHLEGRLASPSRRDMGGGDSPPPDKVETLLASGRDPLVTRLSDKQWGDGQVIVVTNGSFVLNYPLVNRENRKLAGKLVAECGAAGRAVFIESGPGGPKVLDKEPASGDPTALELLKVWPLNAILLHLVILGIVFCLARSPIFGRPRELPPDSPADFGKHVAALGQLLARTQDRHYAQARLAHYRQIAERKSGRSHLKSK